MAVIIFDFDGTIADSFDYVAGFLAGESKASKLDDQQKAGLRGQPMAAMARQLGHHWWQLPRLFFRGRQRMGQAIKHVKPFTGMPEVIRKLHEEGHELFIVSSNAAGTVRAFLADQKLNSCFLEVYGGISLFGKAPALRRLLRNQHIQRGNAVYVGDELRDVQAAQSVKLHVIAVTWGFARPDDLKALKPTAIAQNPTDLINVISEL